MSNYPTFAIRRVCVTLVVLTLILGSGCEPRPTAEVTAARAEESVQRILAWREVVAGNTRFALDLYHQLRRRDGNLFLSPSSVSVALAMTYAGDRGDTERQMAQVLHFTLPQARLHGAFAELDAGLLDSDTVLVLANAVYFHGCWLHPFELKNTRPAAFHVSAARTIEVPTMHQTGDFGYARDDEDRAFVSVDEVGTEAAASTAVIMKSSLPAFVQVDRPFLFLIRDRSTGNILFLGRIVDPTQS